MASLYKGIEIAKCLRIIRQVVVMDYGGLAC